MRFPREASGYDSRAYATLASASGAAPQRRPEHASRLRAATSVTFRIRAARGATVERSAWEDYRATSQLTLSTWNVFRPYRNNKRLQPFDFLAVGVLNQNLYSPAISKKPGIGGELRHKPVARPVRAFVLACRFLTRATRDA